MLKVNVAICDDNKNTLDTVSGAVGRIFEANGAAAVIDAFSSASKLLTSAAEKKYNIVFLDIDMPGLDGIECGKKLRESVDSPEIIYVSGREDRVFESFTVRPFGFVRKLNFLSDISDVVRQYVSSLRITGSDKAIDVQTHDGRLNVALSRIEYFEGCGVYQLMHLKGESQPTEIVSRMEKLEKELTEYGFMRVHKGYLVNYAFIGRIDNAEVTMLSGVKIPVSRRKIHEVKAQYLALGRKYGVLMF